MDWAQVLVIILSAFLAVFLLLGIVLAILLIRLTQQIRAVTSSAERTARGMESFVGSLTKLSTPLMAMRVIGRQIKKFKKRKGGE